MSLLNFIVETVQASWLNIIWLVLVLLFTFGYPVVRSLRKYQNPALNLPRIGEVPGVLGNTSKGHFHNNSKELLAEGYKKYKNQPYSIWTTTMDRVIVPCTLMADFNSLRRSELLLTATVRHAGEYTGMDIAEQGSLHFNVCATQLTQNIGSLAHSTYTEITHAINAQLDKAERVKDWYSIPLHSLLMGIITASTARAFVGYPLCRDQEWLETALQYTRDVTAVCNDLEPHWRLTWPVISLFLSSYRRLRGRFAVARRLLLPIIEERSNNPGKNKPTDLLQWLIDTAKGEDSKPDMLIKRILFLNMASIDTTSLTSTNILLDLLARPDYILELRKEIQEVFSSRPSLDGEVLHRLNKTDSFMKEAQRLHPIGFVTFNRQLAVPFTLSDGTHLPAGTFLSVPAYFSNRDAEYWKSPSEFDGHRFYNMRLEAEDPDAFKFSSMGKNWPQWGTGKFSCPGRWWASGQIKLVIAALLLQYEISYPDGQTERPENISKGGSQLPSFTQRILLRERSLK